MIEYICKYQDSYKFAHLFEHNCVEMITKGVVMSGLFSSTIFNATIDCEQWPGVSYNTETMFVPYNGSIFKTRYAYPQCFKKVYLEDEKKSMLDEAGKLDSTESKMYKI